MAEQDVALREPFHVQVWVSDIVGGDVHKVCTFTFPPDASAISYEWVPGDKLLSVAYNGNLYTFDAQ